MLLISRNHLSKIIGPRERCSALNFGSEDQVFRLSYIDKHKYAGIEIGKDRWGKT